MPGGKNVIAAARYENSHYTRKRVSWTTEAKAVTGDDNALARPKMKLFYSPGKALSEGEACKNRVLLFT